MSHWKVTIRSTDKAYSKWIRRNGVCEICGRSDIKLEAAHYFGRRKESTRFDNRNVHCLCYTCHKKSHEDKSIYKNFMIKKYGQDGLDLLEYESNQIKKRDDELDKLYIKDLCKQLKELK